MSLLQNIVSFIGLFVKRDLQFYIQVVSIIYISSLRYRYTVRYRIHQTMGWLPLVGSLNLQVAFAEYHLFHRAFFAKETYNIKEPTNCIHPIVIYVSVHMYRQLIRYNHICERI